MAEEDSSESLLSVTHNSPQNVASKNLEKKGTTTTIARRPQSEYVHRNNAKKNDAHIARRGRLNESQSVQTSDIDTSPEITPKNIIQRNENIRSTKGDDLQTTDEEEEKENYKYRNSRAVVLKEKTKRKKRKLFRLP
jgi:hypothetical protein